MAKKKPGTALVSMKDLEQQYAVDAKVEAEREPVSGVASINIAKKKFIFNEMPLDNPLRVVVVASAFTNTLYGEGYDPNVSHPPICSAVAYEEKDLKPDPKGPGLPTDGEGKPISACAFCPNNAFGSAESGRGKACRNSRRLAVLLEESLHLDDPSYAILSISPAGLAAWSKYVKGLARTLNRPPHGVITSFSFDEEQTSPVVVPIKYDLITDLKAAQTVNKKRAQLLEAGELVRPFDMTPREAGKVAPRAKTAARGKVAKKKARF